MTNSFNRVRKHAQEAQAKGPDISVFLPVNDEEANLLPLTRSWTTPSKNSMSPPRIVYVDDGSADRSLNVLREIASRDRGPRGCAASQLWSNGGQWCGHLMLRAAKSNPMDADMQNDPRISGDFWKNLTEAMTLFRMAQESKDKMITRRISLPNLLISWIGGVALHDYGCP